jgi:hypothetical protein
MANLLATTVNGTLTALTTENVQTVSYQLALADRNRVVTMNNTTAVNVTVPADATVNFPVGSVVQVARINTGVVNLVAAGGVTLSKTGTFAINEEIILRKRAANNWIVTDTARVLTGTGGSKIVSGIQAIHSYTATGAQTFTVS